MADSAAAQLPLVARLNKESKKLHKLSNSLVNTKLVALLSDRELYGKALASFYYVFSALEDAVDKALERNDPDLLKFKDTLKGGLYRAPGFREDVEYFLGSDWEQRYKLRSEAVAAYESHLQQLSAQQPRLLLAHVFTQHLAAASGGQMVRRWARRHLGLPEDKGTAAFEFKGDSNNTLRSHFKKQLDEWGRSLSEEEVQAFIGQHFAAFHHNNAIIRAFHVSLTSMLRGLARILPPRLLLGP
ncbi:hypothetical protein Agub_g6569, partial [Astrephomene gubernaculifera]